MPGSNPVSSHPSSNTTQPKSLRSRFGFGNGPSNMTPKSSFFAQLNLKPSKKSLGSSQDRTGQEQVVVVIDSPVEKESLLNGHGHKGSKSQDFDSLSRATASRIKNIFTNSSPSINSTSLERHRSLEQFRNPIGLDHSLTSEDLAVDNSGTSKQLPELPADLSLIMNEQPLPDTASSHSELGDQSHGSIENIGTSLLSNDMTMKRDTKGITDAWLNPLEDANGLSSPDTSGVHLSTESSLLSNGSGPVVTSTPFHSRRVSHAQPQEKDNDISLNLSALDPDLVALLRPNNLQEPAPAHPALPIDKSESTSASVSPDISPTQTCFRLPIGQGDSPSPTRLPGVTQATSPPSPLRASFRSQNNIPSHAPRPTPLRDHIPWLELHKDGSRQPSPGPSTVASSDLATPSDISKYTGPLFTPSFSKSDGQRKRDTLPLQNAALSIQTEIPRSRPPRQAQVLLSDSRPSSRLTQRANEYRPRSASSELSRPYGEVYSGTVRERDRTRVPIEEAFSTSRPASRISLLESSLANSVARPRGNSVTNLPQARDTRDRDLLAKRRLRKRSMSLDQGPSNSREELRVNDMLQFRHRKDTSDDAQTEGGHSSNKHSALEFGSGPTYSFRDNDRDRYNRSRDQPVRISRDWLGPRTARAFAAAGLLDDSKEREGSRYSPFSRSTNERDYPYGMRDPTRSGLSPAEREQDRETYRYSDRDYRSSTFRSGAISPSISSSSRPLSRADSWSYSRPTTVFSRTMSDLVSHHSDKRDSFGSIHPRTGSSYSGLQSGSTGSGGGRTSPTGSPLITPQSQIQSLKEKHDTQTEALLSALADSQNTCKELRAQNEALKAQIQRLEERLAESIANAKEKESALAHALNKRRYSTGHTAGRQASSNRLEYRAPRQPSPSRYSNSRPISPGSRRASSSSSIFPTIPKSMSLLLSERPETPASQESSNQSSPPSPTLVLPKSTGKERAPEPSIPESFTRTHKRSTSGLSVATSTNFSFEASSPGSLKLKPEHELLLGDITQLSLTSGEIGEEPQH